MEFYERLLKVQEELKVPKGRKNSFGNYSYRSCEDILSASKPLLAKYELLLYISEKIELIGDRYYIVSTATLQDVKSDKCLSVSGYARENEEKKGMDTSQITGATSSYAKKYALGNLFGLDDTKDADTDEFTKKPIIKLDPKSKISKDRQDTLRSYAKSEKDIGECKKILADNGFTKAEEVTNEKYPILLSQLAAKLGD